MKITNRQVFWIMLLLEVGINLLISIRAVLEHGRQDVWICYLVAGLCGWLITYIAVKVSLRHPDQTLIEFAVTVLGKWPGKLLVIPYLFQWFWVLNLILRDQFLFIRLNVLYETPSWLIISCMLAIIVYAVYKGGIEAIGRCAELWAPLLLLILALTFTLTVNNLEWRLLLPVYADTGIAGIGKGTLGPAYLLGESVFLMMLFPFVENPGKGTQRAALAGVLVSSFILLIGGLWVLLTFGPEISAKLQFPFFEMVKLVYLMEFIQNMDILVMSIWLVSIFIKLSVYLFIISYGLAQWVGKARNWKRFVGPVAGMTFLLTMWMILKYNPSEELMRIGWIRYMLTLNMVLIPLLLWGVSVLRYGRKSSILFGTCSSARIQKREK
ncbi:GerAB/ArcD/ProY family transporter [Paenibacillus puerhi]|uniref:GerAB/ArcD/ProY family transporter n=1 Tax=Paenibacillus puerhi TaxID=2692622 RepID=UPI00135CB53C|nr:endospore germination permease [Paenibacillus puerhi]